MKEKELLEAFTDSRSEEAFGHLVRRYAGLVYAAARRRIADTSLAEDITQIVFIRFAKNPPKLKTHAELAAWLHRTTVHASIDLWRSETRRRAREMEAVVMEPAASETPRWEEISPELDEALDCLNEDDRQALLLRFFSQKSMREVGAALGVSEDAAKMRVSRALDRLRTQMGVTAAGCTALVLGSLLAEHSAEAAPAQLLARLTAIKLPAAAGLGLAGMIRQMSKMKFAIGAAVVVILVLGIIHFTHVANGPIINSTSGVSQADSGIDQTANTNLRPVNSSAQPPVLSSVLTSPKVTTIFRVTDSATGLPLEGAKVHAVYIGIGGSEEPHDFFTDKNGAVTTSIPGGNVFIAAEGHVPVGIMFQENMPADYSIKLDPAMTVNGIIEDEQGRPVSGVKILVQDPGIVPGHKVNVDFQICPVTNRDDGTWSCSYLPFDYTNEIRFILRKNGYASTYPVVPVNRTGLTNLVLVINRGHTIVGRVIGAQDEPVADALITVLTDEPGKDQSTETDNNGFYTLDGIAGDPAAGSEIPLLVTNDNGTFVIRGLAGNGPLHVDLAIQADGFAPQTASVSLSAPTNKADFVLSLGNIFRGHLVDESGHPISDAVVQTDWNNQGIRDFDWHTRTDVDGGFEWDFAPTGAVLYWFEVSDYQVQRDVPLVADGSDHRIILKPYSSQ